jgi:hypothetical protein
MLPEAIPVAYFISPSIRNTNTAGSHIAEVITLILLECLELGVYVMPPEDISTVNFRNPFRQ